MEPKDYVVSKIEGEYAYLQDESSPDTEELFLALALLPLTYLPITFSPRNKGKVCLK